MALHWLLLIIIILKQIVYPWAYIESEESIT